MFDTLLVVLVLLAVVGALAWGAFAIARWARRTGRRPWAWVLGAYVAATLLWAAAQAWIEQLNQ